MISNDLCASSIDQLISFMCVMKLIFLSMLMTVGLWNASSLAQTVEVSDVALPITVRHDKTVLALNGAGVQEVLWIDMYVAALYLPRVNKSSQQIIDADEAMAIRLEVVSILVSSKRMEIATRKAFERTTGGNTEPYVERMEEFIGLFATGIKVGKEFTIIYIPDVGTKIYSANQLKTIIPGYDFKRMLFNIWLGENGADKDLRVAMLGN